MKQVVALDNGIRVENDPKRDSMGAYYSERENAYWIYGTEWAGRSILVDDLDQDKIPYMPVFSVMRQDGSNNDTCYYSPGYNVVLCLKEIFDNRRELDSGPRGYRDDSVVIQCVPEVAEKIVITKPVNEGFDLIQRLQLTFKEKGQSILILLLIVALLYNSGSQPLDVAKVLLGI